MGRVLAVDPGEARIGLAISDESGTIARPLAVLRHSSRDKDAEGIAQRARLEGAERIVVGIALDADGSIGPQARRAQRLIEALRAHTQLPIETWDESGSTQAAARGWRRDALLDARAAAVILQEYLDARRTA
ncbi:MAG: Holliday junction resolvase RuvX [Chloroflexota bacterium]